MSIDKDYKVLIHHGDTLLASYTLHTEYEDGEYIDVSSSHIFGEPNDDPIEDKAVEVILEAETASGRESIDEYTVEWHLIN
ncbi:MAG: hypothetical protein ABW094_03525 [Candidatus Thiodiazotropha sp.]